MLDCFAVAAPGLEPIVAAELVARGAHAGTPVRGGVPFRATVRELYDANAWLRGASRVVVRAARFPARSFADLERHAAAIDWGRWVAPDCRAVVRVSSSGSRLFHTGAIAARIQPHAGGTDAPDACTQLVVVRVVRDEFTVSIDASGDHLHRRGWRLATAKAPLRETLAAAMVLASGWDRTAPLVDPLCGSGTIAIEAACIAAGRAPGAHRDFAFQRWPTFEPGTWASVAGDVRRAEAAATTRTATRATIVAADRDAGAVRATRANAERAGVSAMIDVRIDALSATAHALRAIEPPGWVLTNPPYGARVRGGDLRDLYASIGALGRAELAGWRLGLLVADRALAAHTGLPLTERFHTTNGGIPVRFVTTDAGR